MREHTGKGIFILLLGILLLGVLANLFRESFGTFTYIFIPVPLIGILDIFTERKRFGPVHGRLTTFALVLVILFFLLVLLLGYLYQYSLVREADFRSVRRYQYASFAAYVIPMAASIIAVAELAGKRGFRCVAGAMVVCLLLTVAGLFLLRAPLTDHIDEVEEIYLDDVTDDNVEIHMYEGSVNRFNEESETAYLPMAAAGLVTLVTVAWAGREPLGNLRDMATGRMRKNLTKRKEMM